MILVYPDNSQIGMPSHDSTEARPHIPCHLLYRTVASGVTRSLCCCRRHDSLRHLRHLGCGQCGRSGDDIETRIVGGSCPGWMGVFLAGLRLRLAGASANLPTTMASYLYINMYQTKPVPPPGFGITSIEVEWPRITYTHKGRNAPSSQFIDLLEIYNTKITDSMKICHLFITLLFSFLAYILCNIFPYIQVRTSRTS